MFPQSEFARPQQWRPGTGLLLGAAMALAAILAPHAGTAQTSANEYQIKATYLFDFSKFVKWPADSPVASISTFDICVLGQDPFGTILDSTVAGEKMDGVPVAVRRLTDANEAKSCRVVFISKSLEPHLASVLAVLGKSDALTVSDIPHFSRRGGMIEFVPAEGRVRFGINLESAQRSRLTVSSELLKVATSVIAPARSGGLV